MPMKSRTASMFAFLSTDTDVARTSSGNAYGSSSLFPRLFIAALPLLPSVSLSALALLPRTELSSFSSLLRTKSALYAVTLSLFVHAMSMGGISPRPWSCLCVSTSKRSSPVSLASFIRLTLSTTKTICIEEEEEEEEEEEKGGG